MLSKEGMDPSASMMSLRTGEEEDVGAEEEEDDSHLLKALEHGCQNEEALNRKYMSDSVGNQVKYGDSVQLKHIKSGKYITITTTKTAETERENLVSEHTHYL